MFAPQTETHIELVALCNGRFTPAVYDTDPYNRRIRRFSGSEFTWAGAFEVACRCASIERPFYCQGYKITGLDSPEIAKAQHAAWWHGVVSPSEANAAFAPIAA